LVSGCFGAAVHPVSGNIDILYVPISSAIFEISILSNPISGLSIGMDVEYLVASMLGNVWDATCPTLLPSIIANAFSDLAIFSAI